MVGAAAPRRRRLALPSYLDQLVDQLERLQLDRVVSTVLPLPLPVELQLDRLQLDRDHPATSEPSALLQLERLQLDRV